METSPSYEELLEKVKKARIGAIIPIVKTTPIMFFVQGKLQLQKTY